MMANKQQPVDRVPPQNLEAEMNVLGAMLLDKEAIAQAIETVSPDSFYVDANARIYSAIVELYDSNQPIDIVTVTEKLRKKKELELVGGASYISMLLESIPSTASVGHYLQIVREKATLRRLIKTSSQIVERCYEGVEEVSDVLDGAEKEIFDIAQYRQSQGFVRIGDLIKHSIETVESLYQRKEHVTGVASGFTDLDTMTAGFHPSELIIIAARPSMGKTSMALNVAEYLAITEKAPVAVFSLEMAKEQLVLRMLCSHSRVNAHNVRTGFISEKHDFPKLVNAAGRLATAPIFIDDTPAMSVLEMRAKARRLVAREGIRLIIVDYLQLMRTQSRKAENRQQEISEISRSLKALARELSVPIMVLSQLNREAESRPDHRPRLCDLRECVTGETLVVCANGRRIPVRDLVGTSPEVIALTEEGKLVRGFSDRVWPVGRRPIFKVVLASGRAIRATAEHRLLTGSGWKRIKDLSVEDRLAIARFIPEPETTLKWSDLGVALLGHLIGDGSYLSGQPLRYTTSSHENSEIVNRAAVEEFGVTVTRCVWRGGWHQLILSGNGNRWHPAGINLWLRELGVFNQRAHEKRIPQEVFRLSNRQIGLLLQHLWATDGSIHARKEGQIGGHTIYYSTTSPGLASDVASLLQRLGIISRIQITKKGSYRQNYMVHVSGATMQLRFLELVGSFGPRRPQAEQLAKTLEGVIANTNVDTLPQEIFDHVKRKMASVGISHRKMASIRGTSYGGSAHFNFSPSPALVLDYAEILDDEYLLSQAERDLFWDRVIAIEHDGEDEAFDLTVPEHCSWLADGIVSHNSGAIEQDADVVLLLFREEYYEPDNEEAKGRAEVIIAKQRNGPVGKVNLTFLEDCTHFENFTEREEELEPVLD